MSRTFKIAAALIAASLAFAPAALAQTSPKDPSLRVGYGDLDMSSPAGGVALLKRIEGAARRVCDDAMAHSPLTPRAISTCRRATIDSTVRGLNLGTLTLAWSGKYPETAIAAR
jgi:UrcA family protein